MGPFGEAVGATLQPCTFLLIVPVVAAAIVAGNRWRALVAIVLAAIVGGWLVAANWFVLDGVWLRLAALAAGLALVATSVPAVHERVPLTPERSNALAAGAVTLLATMWWRPCVGDELGSILSRRALAGQLLPMALYMLGAMAPVAIVVLAQYAFEPPERLTRVASWAALVVGLVLMGSLVGGQHGHVVVTLTRWTLD